MKINHFFIITKIIAILSYILQYSKYNYIYFDNFQECVSHSVGHFVETFPIAITAFILYFSGILNKLKTCRKSIIFYCIFGNYFIFKYDIFLKIEKYGSKYNYNGFDKNFFAVFSFIGFYLIPFDSIKSNKLKIFIKFASNYTQGIYCLHPIMRYYTTNFFHLKRTFQGCIIIYLSSYLISFIGAKISYNTKLKYLFM